MAVVWDGRILANAGQLPLADNSVHCVVTSPPYWCLRKYAAPDQIYGGRADCGHAWEHREIVAETTESTRWQHTSDDCFHGDRAAVEAERTFGAAETGTCAICGAWRGQLGLEPSGQTYVEHLVAIFSEVRRVLHPAGVVFLNIGDSYVGSGKSRGPRREQCKQSTNYGSLQGTPTTGWRGQKAKDRACIPYRLALALLDGGWFIRSPIIWVKNSPFPESVLDRPTRSYEYIFLLSKSARYFYDSFAVRTKLKASSVQRLTRDVSGQFGSDRIPGKSNGPMKAAVFGGAQRFAENPTRLASGKPGIVEDPEIGANLRDVWVIPSQGYKGAHYATFPEELPRRCILLGTSARGCCPRCLNPWKRVVSPSEQYAQRLGKSMFDHRTENERGRLGTRVGLEPATADYETTGWRPTCRHGLDPIPCTVLDPFAGTGTTARVAEELGRRWISADLAYQDLQHKRLERVQKVLLQL